MVSTEILPSTQLQVTPGACENCSELSSFGQKQAPNGSFFDHFNNSLEQSLAPSNGKLLPDGGNLLPQIPLQIAELAYVEKLQPLLQEFNNIPVLQNVEINNINKQLSDTSVEQSDLLKTVNELGNLPNVLDIESNKVGPRVDDIDSVLTKLDPSSLTVAHPSSTQFGVSNPPYANLDSALEKPSDLGRNSSIVSTIVESDSSGKVQLHNNITNNTDIQNKITKDSLSEPVFTRQYSEDNYDIDILNQKQPVDRELLHQALSTYKSNSTTQSINPIISNDLNQRINIANSTYSTSDDHVLSSIKQGLNETFEMLSKNTEQSLNQSIKWLVGNKIQNAKINLYPETLGHLNISLNLDDSKLTINILANNIAAKEIIEANISNLREHLNESGISLEEATVNHQSSSQEEQFSENNNTGGNDDSASPVSSNDAELSSSASKQNVIHSEYLIDAYV